MYVKQTYNYWFILIEKLENEVFLISRLNWRLLEKFITNMWVKYNVAVGYSIMLMCIRMPSLYTSV